MKLKEKILHSETEQLLAGIEDRNLRVFKSLFGFDVSIHNSEIVVDADESHRPFLEEIFKTLIMLAEHKIVLSERDVIYIVKMAQNNKIVHRARTGSPRFTEQLGAGRRTGSSTEPI